MGTKIEWVRNQDGTQGMTWNPVTGCSKVSPGCEHCYAERMSHRFGWTTLPWTGPNAAQNVRLHPDRLEKPLHWRRPRTVFVCSMSDLFHEQVPDEYIDRVFAVMALCRQHTFQVLTKRPERASQYLSVMASGSNKYRRRWDAARRWLWEKTHGTTRERVGIMLANQTWPLPNVWLGVTAEDQRRADERVPLLLETPAAVRFVSAEPLLGRIDMRRWLVSCDGCGNRRSDSYVPSAPETSLCRDACVKQGEGSSLDWVIVGGESGPDARPMHPDWVQSIRDQCQAVGVPFFFKGWGEWLPNDQEYGANPGNCDYEKRHVLVGNVSMCRAGKKYAGRLLDGRTWDEMPSTALRQALEVQS